MATTGRTESGTLSHLELVRAAVLAPTPDNNQPWRFMSRGGELQVHLDRGRTLPSDVNGMFDLIGLGAAIENIRIAACEKGFQTAIKVHAGGSGGEDGDRIATLSFSPGGKGDALFPQLAARVTCRKMYGTRPIAPDRLQKLVQACGEFQDIRLDWLTDRAKMGECARLVASTDKIRFEYEPFHNEICKQLRFSVEEAEQTRDGLDLRTLDLPPGTGSLLRFLRPWDRMKWVHRLGLGGLLTLPSAMAIRKSGAIGVLWSSAPTAERFLEGGRALQRVWLAAQAQGLSFQPVGSVAIFFAHVQLLNGKRLSPRHAARVRALMERYRSLLPALGERTLLLMFRLGESKPPSFRSLRRPAEAVFEQT